jgi:drug/metabolite transporter (DMT)-like permease
VTDSTAAAARAHHLSGRLLVVGATLFWGTSATVARFLFAREAVPTFWVVQTRLLISAAILGVWLALRRPQSLRVPRGDWPYLLILGLFGVAAIQGSYYFTISVLGVGLAILLQYLAPALIVAFQVARGREQLSARTAFVLLAALAGTALLVSGVPRGDWRAHPEGWVTGFASAFFFAFYILYSKRGLAHYRPESVLFYTFLIAGLFWAAVSPIGELFTHPVPARLWWLLLYMAVCSTLVPFALFYAGLRRLSATETGIVATLEPVVAVASSALFLGEGLRPVQGAGAALVLLACIMAARSSPEA